MLKGGSARRISASLATSSCTILPGERKAPRETDRKIRKKRIPSFCTHGHFWTDREQRVPEYIRGEPETPVIPSDDPILTPSDHIAASDRIRETAMCDEVERRGGSPRSELAFRVASRRRDATTGTRRGAPDIIIKPATPSAQTEAAEAQVHITPRPLPDCVPQCFPNNDPASRQAARVYRRCERPRAPRSTATRVTPLTTPLLLETWRLGG